MNLTTFANNTQFPELARAVVRQCGGWDSFREDAPEIARSSADAGWHGFIYHSDTVKFAKSHKTVILAACKEMAGDMGSGSAYDLIAGFNCLKMDSGTVAEAIHNPRSDDHTTVMNALAWFALEEVARAYDDATENA